MTGYWIRHRLLLTLLLSAILALAMGSLFAYPYIEQRADDYNAQSIYQNTDIDFIAPEPSFEQVSELSGTHGIYKVFPFFLTKMDIDVKGETCSATVLLSDQFKNIDITMYNQKRLIEKSNIEFDNPIFADWEFCHKTSAKVGDVLLLNIGGVSKEYRIYAIYETNYIYDGGTVLAQISEEQKEIISKQSNNNGYSNMYISANDYNECKSYLATEYRPLGRLKSREQFDNDEQYQIHYDAITSSGYANEITDFRIMESSLGKSSSALLIWIGVLLAFAVIIGFNMVLAGRGCEKVYFTKHCIPQGQNVKQYYNISFFFESIFTIALYAAILIIRCNLSNKFISVSVYDIKIVAIPAAVIIAEIVSLYVNCSTVMRIADKVKKYDEKG